MGISGLWKKVAPTMQDQSLMGLALTGALERQERSERPLVFGIDASPMLFSAQASVNSARKKGASWTITGSKAELNVLMTYLAHLAEVPGNMEFWFDSPTGRPQRKRGRHVGGPEHQLTQDFKHLIRGFGFRVYEAPGEAEAELAFRNKIGLIDYVYTPDSDIFLFGATQILRTSQDRDNRDAVQLYTKHALLEYEPHRLSRAGIMLIAIMSGGDYDPVGLQGCGIDTAYSLAGSYLAITLYKMVRSQPTDADLTLFLEGWRNDLRNELSSNVSGHLPCKKPAVAAAVNDDWPSIGTLRAYGTPRTSATELSDEELNDCYEGYDGLQFPDTKQLATTMCRLFDSWEWSQVLHKFCELVWPGHFNRQMIDTHRARILHRNAGFGIQSVDGISRIDTSKSQNAPFPYYRVKIWPVSQSSRALHAYTDARNAGPTAGDVTISETALISVPAPILQRAMPELVEEFHRSRPHMEPSNFWPNLHAQIQQKAAAAQAARRLTPQTPEFTSPSAVIPGAARSLRPEKCPSTSLMFIDATFPEPLYYNVSRDGDHEVIEILD